MNPSGIPAPASTGWPRLPLPLIAALLAAFLLAAYVNSFRVPFIFDDVLAIPENPSLDSWRTVLSPPGNGSTVSGRPLLNLTFALNRAVSGNHVWSYHALNLVIHFLSALTLYGLARRTFLTAPLAGRHGPPAAWLALTLALLWALHPLQTESVTYIVQRAESLAGLFYLLTLSCFVRGAQTASGAGKWFAAAAGACLLGVATKETLVTAPVVALLYDRVFLAGSFRAIWQRRRGAHALLLASWLPLGLLVLSTGGNRGGTFAFTSEGFRDYWLSQFEAITTYLRLAFWPRPLIFDYAFVKGRHVADVAGHALVVLALIGIGAWAWWRRPVVGFLAAAFFILLAPSSLMPGTVQSIVEHRTYLPLAVVLAFVVGGLYEATGCRGLMVLLVVPVLGFATFRRNADYASNFSIWRDTVAKAPNNARAHNNLGNLLDDAGQWQEARREYETALRLQPDYATAHYNFGNLLVQHGRIEDVVAHYQEAIRLDPRLTDAHFNLGKAYLLQNRWDDARKEFEAVLRAQPQDVMAYFNLGSALANLGRRDEAVARLREALRLNPNHPEARQLLTKLGQSAP